MKHTKILVIGSDQEILATVLRVINKNPGWVAEGASSDEEAMAAFISHSFDLVMLTNGIDNDREQKLKQFFAKHHPGIPVIQHYGGGSGLLKCEITQAMERREFIC